MTQHGGTYAKESLDGRDHVLRKNLRGRREDGSQLLSAGIWRVPAAGGEEVQIVRDVASYGNFAVAREGIYFESSPPDSPLATSRCSLRSPARRPRSIS